MLSLYNGKSREQKFFKNDHGFCHWSSGRSPWRFIRTIHFQGE